MLSSQIVSLTSFGKCPSIVFMGRALSCCKLISWWNCTDGSYKESDCRFAAGWPCDFTGFENFQRLFADGRMSLWSEDSGSITVILCFPQPGWSKWPFAMIGLNSPVQHGNVDLHSVCTCPLLSATKMFNRCFLHHLYTLYNECESVVCITAGRSSIPAMASLSHFEKLLNACPCY